MNQAKQARDKAIARLESVRGEYLEQARREARRLSRKGSRSVSVDDVREVCPPPSSIDPRVMGAIFSTNEWKAVEYINSKRRACHARPIRRFMWVG